MQLWSVNIFLSPLKSKSPEISHHCKSQIGDPRSPIEKQIWKVRVVESDVLVLVGRPGNENWRIQSFQQQGLKKFFLGNYDNF